MPDYLSKEEIRKWRSSLERITLEEYAARLGKVIQEEKHDDSIVDTVILKSLNSMTTETYKPGTERISTLSLRSFAKEREIKEEKQQAVQKEEVTVKQEEMPVNKNAVNKEKRETKTIAAETAKAKEMKPVKPSKTVKAEKIEKPVKSTTVKNQSSEEATYSFSKTLTAREQLVFEHFLENRNTIVYAAELAKILGLPRDYVYKYIKNLRSKLEGDFLQNAENGGYILKAK